MRNVIEKVIESKNYELSDMLKKIDTLWVQGSITEEAKKNLSDKARANASTQNSIDVLSKLEELDRRVKELENVVANMETKEPEEEPAETTYPAYQVGKWYYNGDVVMFEGKAYKCIAPDKQVCTWSPTEYPVYWEVTE